MIGTMPNCVNALTDSHVASVAHVVGQMPQDVVRRNDADQVSPFADDWQMAISAQVHPLHGEGDLCVGNQRLRVGAS